MIPDGIRAVCFDAFGTLVAIGDRTSPYRTLGRLPGARAVLSRALLEPLGFLEIAALCGAGTELAERLAGDLSRETGSIAPRPSMDGAWEAARSSGLRVGLCSNLAEPYVDPLLAALPWMPDAAVLSCREGMAKPDPAIYDLVCMRLGMPPERVLFVGDTPSADVDGPRAFGMSAMPVSEFEAALRTSAAPPTR